MATIVTPIPAAVKAEVLKLLQEAQELLSPYQVSITDAERKSLGSTAMGRESIPFAEQGQQLLANFPQIMPRTVTDAELASYPAQLQSFRDADDISVAAGTIVAQLSGNKLVTGNFVMSMARSGYRNAKADNGRTPGVKPIIDMMSLRFDNGNDSGDDPKPPTPPTK